VSYVEAIENASPRQIAARQEYLERRKRLGAPKPQVRPLFVPIKSIARPEPVAPAPVTNPDAVLVAEVDITAAFPILLTEIPFPFRKSAMFDRIKRVVCARYEIERADLIGHRRFNKFVRPRQIAMYLAKRLTFCSLPEIGRRFGGKDHTTVLHSHRKIAAIMASDAVFAADIESLCAKLKRG
jgi:hypothetical protein